MSKAQFKARLTILRAALTLQLRQVIHQLLPATAAQHQQMPALRQCLQLQTGLRVRVTAQLLPAATSQPAALRPIQQAKRFKIKNNIRNTSVKQGCFLLYFSYCEQ
jgi:hypothetical protein